MTIKFIGGSSDADRIIVDYTELTLKALQGELQNRDLNFTVDSSTIINYSYKHSAGRNYGELTEDTVLSLDPTSVVMITQQPRETKARAYDSEELQEVINEAKAALINQEYKALRAACRELSQAGAEVKELIGNYTHYSISSLVDAVERAVKFFSPDVVELCIEDFQAIIARIEAIEAKVDRIQTTVDLFSISEIDQDLIDEVAEIKADVDFINQHFDLK
jgi:hypothetical protein